MRERELFPMVHKRFGEGAHTNINLDRDQKWVQIVVWRVSSMIQMEIIAVGEGVTLDEAWANVSEPEPTPPEP